jgi:S-formylglutathione hydrolase FrmB
MSSDSEPSRFITRELASAALGCSVRYGAYVPLLAGEARVPLLFLLHGAEASHLDFCQHAHAELLQLAAAHEVAIVVPEGSRDGWYVDSPTLPQHQYQTHLLAEVLPDAAAWLGGASRQAIAGISAGGNAALVCALEHPSLFVSVSSLSGALDLQRAKQRPALQRALGHYEDDPQLWQRFSARHVLARQAAVAQRLPVLLSVGTSDIWAEPNRAFAAELNALGCSCELHESSGGHDWKYWVAQLPEHIAFHARVLTAPE